MAISKKRAPSAPNQEMTRIVQQIYDDLNDIINSVNQSGREGGVGSRVEKGKIGDTRVIKQNDNTHRLEVYTEDGWGYIDLNLVNKTIKNTNN